LTITPGASCASSSPVFAVGDLVERIHNLARPHIVTNCIAAIAMPSVMV
jgi:hypothetical protein